MLYVRSDNEGILMYVRVSDGNTVKGLCGGILNRQVCLLLFQRLVLLHQLQLAKKMKAKGNFIKEEEFLCAEYLMASFS